jgi:succinate dehydrogenase / fumarate reductase iron-sulfur subunit
MMAGSTSAGTGAHAGMNLTLHVWRQRGPGTEGRMVTYDVADISPDMSFLEMLDVLNERLQEQGQEPIAFDHDCREGICGSCSLMINGAAHGPETGTATCQLHMRSFRSGDVIYVEPWRSRAFPIIKDLVVDRGALDRIIQAGGYISVKTGSAPDGNAIPIPKTAADASMDAAQCIGCGACVAACPNGSASLFTAAKVAHLSLLPQGQTERYRRVIGMVDRMDAEGFGGCTLYGECQEACPKEISIDTITRMNRDYITASLRAANEGGAA